MAPPQESEEEDNEFIDDKARYDHYDKIKKRMYIIEYELDQYSNIQKELHAPNAFLISIRMHSGLDYLFSDWAPEWLYSPYVSKRLFSPTMEIIKVSQGDVGCLSSSAPYEMGSLESIYSLMLNSEVERYFYTSYGTIESFTRWFTGHFPETLRFTHRDPGITYHDSIVSFYKTHSKTLDDPYNPMNLSNITPFLISNAHFIWLNQMKW